jgi:hypothetical protein
MQRHECPASRVVGVGEQGIVHRRPADVRDNRMARDSEQSLALRVKHDANTKV